MSQKDTNPLSKDFYIKLALAPIIAMLLSGIIVVAALGSDGFLDIWQGFLSIFVIFEITVIIALSIIPSRIKNIFSVLWKKPYIITFGFLINLIFLIHSRHKFLLDFHPFQEDLLLLISFVAAWLIFPIIFSKKFLDLSLKGTSFYVTIPFLILGGVVMGIVVASVIFFAIVDVLIIIGLLFS
jgi:hypothetical protein